MTSGMPALELEGLDKTLGRTQAVDNVRSWGVAGCRA